MPLVDLLITLIEAARPSHYRDAVSGYDPRVNKRRPAAVCLCCSLLSGCGCDVSSSSGRLLPWRTHYDGPYFWTVSQNKLLVTLVAFSWVLYHSNRRRTQDEQQESDQRKPKSFRTMTWETPVNQWTRIRKDASSCQEVRNEGSWTR